FEIGADGRVVVLAKRNRAATDDGQAGGGVAGAGGSDFGGRKFVGQMKRLQANPWRLQRLHGGDDGLDREFAQRVGRDPEAERRRGRQGGGSGASQGRGGGGDGGGFKKRAARRGGKRGGAGHGKGIEKTPGQGKP